MPFSGVRIAQATKSNKGHIDTKSMNPMVTRIMSQP
jgi:hypothetical protein